MFLPVHDHAGHGQGYEPFQQVAVVEEADHRFEDWSVQQRRWPVMLEVGLNVVVGRELEEARQELRRAADA